MTAQLQLDREQDLDLSRGLSTEWLETNGCGDFASSTLWLAPARRYHGLLVARFDGNEKRHLFLSRFEETVVGPRGELPLSVTRFEEDTRPRGDRFLSTFSLAPHPRWSFALETGELVREVLLVAGERTVLTRYTLRGSEPVRLRLRPLLPFRDADALTIANEVAEARPEASDGSLAFRLYDALPALHLSATEPLQLTGEADWLRGVELELDRARGYPSVEDHLAPGTIEVELADSFVIAASLEGPVADPAALWEEERARRSARWKEARTAAGKKDDGAAARLAYRAEDFLMRLDGRTGVDAGYPWFGEWGRDTFLSLPGLTLARGQAERCAAVLTESLAYLVDGLLPNIFGRSVESSHYGSVDASLWYARAVELYERDGGDPERVREEYLPALLEIATAYWDGTGLGIRADEAGLLQAGDDRLNATWMDAHASDGPVTPRHGCAVEINALWYALLRQLEKLLEGTGDRKGRKLWRARRMRAKASFLERFWLPSEERLADVWREDEIDRSVRPNMVIAAALRHSPLTKAQRASVLACADRELLTPRGLRTLSPSDPHYQGTYAGDPDTRDRAYHQGTVWPWLFGFHVEGWLRVDARRPVRDRLRAQWASIVGELDERGLGHVSEVFSGDAPHAGGGTIAQAWNTAELLRAHRLLSRGKA